MTLPAGDPPSSPGAGPATAEPPVPTGLLPTFDTITEEEIAAARAARTTRVRAQQPPPPDRRRGALGWVLVVAGALVVSMLVRLFAFQQFWIPSPSMSETLVRNDRVLVNKLAYKVHDVRRGDVVVFERPENQNGSIQDLIKRVVALPGEHVSIMDGQVRIDGRLLEEPYADGMATEANVGCGLGDTTGIDSPGGLRIPDGEVLVLGDNRGNSQDGRCFGPIDQGLIIGRAFVIIWPPSKVGGL